MDIRRVVQQSQDGELTLEEIMSSLREAGLAAIAKGLKENFEKGKKKSQIGVDDSITILFNVNFVHYRC